MIYTFNRKAQQIIHLYQTKGLRNYSGEAISQLEHASQCARFAELDHQDDEVIIAAFLHDIGHLLETKQEGYMDDYGVKNHEKLGSDFLRAMGFSELVAKLVESHVQAKRYLCAVNEKYYNNLSHASRVTLHFQGGPMREDELDSFERQPLKSLIIKMRTWDEAAKQQNVPLINLESLSEKIGRHLHCFNGACLIYGLCNAIFLF